jgi:hypothetical protein
MDGSIRQRRRRASARPFGMAFSGWSGQWAFVAQRKKDHSNNPLNERQGRSGRVLWDRCSLLWFGGVMPVFHVFANSAAGALHCRCFSATDVTGHFSGEVIKNAANCADTLKRKCGAP